MTRHIKTLSCTHMKDERCCNFLILGWYADELDEKFEFAKLANDFGKRRKR